MKNYSTIILRICIILIGIGVIALCSIITWFAITVWKSNSPNSHLMTILIVGMYSCVIPFFIGLYQTIKLLRYIDTNRAFSELSVKSLNYIKYCAVTIFAVCILGGLPFFYYWADLDDAPGLMIIGMIIAGSPFVFAIFVSILQRLLKDAIDLKSENDFTV